MQANRLTIDQAAVDWELPLDAIEESTRYGDTNRALIELEAEEERRRLADAGVPLAPPA